MEEKVRIFAKRYTTAKIAVLCQKEQIQLIMENLNLHFGKDWVFVDTLKSGEGVMFNDELNYKGYHPDIKRYCEAIRVV